MTYPREPNPGDPISAQLIRDIIRCLRRNAPLAGSNVRLRVSPGGTFIDGTPGGAVSGTASHSDLGCWRIGTVVEYEGAEPRKAFLNKFYAVGGTMAEYEGEVFVDEFVLKGDLPEAQEGEARQEYTEDDKPFVAIVVSMDPDTLGDVSVEGYKQMSEMLAAANSPTSFLKPLYKLTHDGGVAVDFRNMPLCSSGEELVAETQS